MHEEAGRARTRGVYLPVRLDAVEEPIGFGQIQSLDLVGWRGRVGDRRFKDVVAAAKALIAGGPRPRPTASRRRNRVVAAIAGAAAMLAAGASVAADVLGLQGVICRAPGVRAVCREVGIGGVPGKDEEALWAARQPGDCATLREYLGRFPRGTYADEAQRRLQASETVVSERWIPEVRHLPLTVRMGLRPLADEGAARQEALERASEDPRLVCEGFDAGEFRLVSAAPQAETWRCERRGSGVVCGFDGRASCHVEARHSTSKQICQ